MIRICFLLGCVLSSFIAMAQAPIQGALSRAQLEWHLSRALTMQPLAEESVCFYGNCNNPCQYDSLGYQSDLKFLTQVQARFIGRVAGLWEAEHRINFNYFKVVANTVQDILKLYEKHQLPRPIIQACIFETVSKDVNGIRMNEETAREFNIPVRNFRYEDMLYDDGYGVDLWRKHASVPDMSKQETQMWFHYLATEFIKAGYEAIHFGQVKIMNKKDPGNVHWWNMLQRIRLFAAHHNRGFVLCDAHTHGEYYKDTDQLLFDFHSGPIRPMEVVGSHRGGIDGGEVEILPGVRDVMFGRSKGGKTWFGWTCNSLPYLVEFDNNGVSDKPNTANVGWWVWGWDEITWFGVQEPTYQKRWLRYAHHRVRELDHNGYLQIPGLKELVRGGIYAKPWPDMFRAVEGDTKYNYNLTQTIRQLWNVKD
jgi:hypothetical protein